MADFDPSSIEKHVFLCADPTTPKCCPREEGLASWEALKTSVEELPPDLRARVHRSKAGCLKYCKQGPIAVVYPEGIWYHSVTPDVARRIVTEHLAKGLPVDEFVLYRPGKTS